MKKIFFVMGALLSGLGFLLSGCGGTFGNPSQKITIANAGTYAIYFPDTNFQDIVISKPENMNDSEFTIEAWIKIPPAGGGGPIFMRGESDSSMILYVDPADNFVKFDVDGQTLSSDVDVVDGNWHHVAGVVASLPGGDEPHPHCSATHTDIYVDGNWENCYANVFPPADIDGCKTPEGQAMKCPLIIGRDLLVTTSLFKGTIDEVRVWKEARDKSVLALDNPKWGKNLIKEWMKKEISGEEWALADPYTKIIGYWKFNEGTGTVATDASGYGHAGAKLQCGINCGSGATANAETSIPWETGWVEGYPFAN